MMTKYFAETKSFDFANLPCPPQDVMEAQWYKPASGEPYRPLLAVPDKVRSLKPEWEDCGGERFYGYDPPQLLTPAAAMVPTPTPAGPIPQVEPAKPSPTTDPGPNETGAARPQKTEPKKGIDSIVRPPSSKSLGLAPDPDATAKIPIATIASQPVIAIPSGGYQVGDTTIKLDSPAAVFSGISVHANSAGELVVGDKTYSPSSSAPTVPTISGTIIIVAETSGSHPVKGEMGPAGANTPTADAATVAIQIALNGGPKSFAIGSDDFALPSLPPSRTTSIDGNVVVAEASGIYNVNGVAVTAGIGTATLSGFAVPSGTSSGGNLVAGGPVVALPPVNASSTRGGSPATAPDGSVTAPQGTAGKFSAPGPLTSQALVGEAHSASAGGRVGMVLGVISLWGWT